MDGGTDAQSPSHRGKSGSSSKKVRCRVAVVAALQVDSGELVGSTVDEGAGENRLV